MNNKGKERYKNDKRKVIIQYEDDKERLILTKTARKLKETVEIKIKHNILNEVKRRATEKDMNPTIPAELKKRIIPRCFRHKCKAFLTRSKTRLCREQRKTKNKTMTKRISPPLIVISDDEPSLLDYDDISSESLSSSYSDDGLEALIESTRKRMRNSEEEWKLIPNHIMSSSETIVLESLSRSPSLNSLETLILVADEEDTPSLDINSAQKTPKLEHLETNYNIIKYEVDHDSKLDVNENRIITPIEAIITKLERKDIELSDFTISNVDMKQELYNDI